MERLHRTALSGEMVGSGADGTSGESDMSEPSLQPAGDVSGQPGADSPPRATAAKEQMITREALLDGSFMAAVRATVERAGVPACLRSDVEIEAALTDALLARPDTPDLWVFCYGSRRCDFIGTGCSRDLRRLSVADDGSS
jgi:hypothetical protein